MHAHTHTHTHKKNTRKRTHTHILQYFASYWNWLDFACNGLLTCCCVLWWILTINHIKPFTISLRHNVYANLQAEANYLHLNGG
jgi:hypothetical protein